MLPQFPSGSAMEFFENHLYLFGDDATTVLVMDTSYRLITTIKIFAGREKRIPKSQKADIEASAIIVHDGQVQLVAFGSASTNIRESAFVFNLPLHKDSTFQQYDTSLLTNRLLNMGVAEMNIEGATVVSDRLLLSNRSNKTNRNNLLFVTDTRFFDSQTESPIHIVEVLLPQQDFPIGISELCYVPEVDSLFFTASVEYTTNAYDDGKIGESYLGYIGHFTSKLYHKSVTPTSLVNLATIDPIFKGQKIEAICFEKITGLQLTAHLVSDNDDGESRMFKIEINL